MLHTTFNQLKLVGACGQKIGSNTGYDKLASYLGGSDKYGKNTPIPLTVILDSNGLDDTLWCLQTVPPEQEAASKRLARLLACDYAQHVLHLYEDKYPGDTRPRHAIEVTRLFAAGKATLQELDAAASDAASAARTAGDASAARTAAADASAARTAGDAASAARAADAASAAWTARAAAADASAARAAAGDARAAEQEWQAQRLRETLLTEV